MNRHLALFSVSILFSPLVVAQGQTPTLLREAAQCLVAKSFLKASTLNLGYEIDRNSWPGEEVLYVVAFTGHSHAKGYAFTIFLTEKKHRQIYDVQNNARFAKARSIAEGEYFGLNFPGPPLGGGWTQEHLAEAINQIGDQPTFSVSAADLAPLFPSVGCIAYTDPR